MTNREFINLHQPEYLTAILIATKQYREECKMITLTQEEKQALTKDLRKARQNMDTDKIIQIKHLLLLDKSGCKTNSIVCSTD